MTDLYRHRIRRTLKPNPAMLSKEEHLKMLKEVDERVLPRREWETDEEYGKRMYNYLNRRDIYAEKYK